MVIESIEFGRFADPADPVEVAQAYAEAGADELLFAVHGWRAENLEPIAERLARSVSIPVTLETDLVSVAEIRRTLEAGAARTVVQRSALRDPDFISELAGAIGSQALGVAVEIQREESHWRVLSGPGGEPTEWDAVNWARVVEAQGGGELIIASAQGGVEGQPFDLELLDTVSSSVRIPVIALGEAPGVGVEDLFDALMIGNADGVLVGSLLHSGAQTIRNVKEYLSEHGLPVRLD